jgi:hypothetical protein
VSEFSDGYQSYTYGGGGVVESSNTNADLQNKQAEELLIQV